MDGFAGRAVDRFEIRLGPARQIDLQAGMTQRHQPPAQRVETPARHLGGKIALDERRQQMMTGRDVERGAIGEVGEGRLAAEFGDSF